jgi:hypothetical protein
MKTTGQALAVISYKGLLFNNEYRIEVIKGNTTTLDLIIRESKEKYFF